MLSRIANHVIGKFAGGQPSEAPFFTYLGYVNPENMESDAHASFDCDGNSYKVMCYYLTKEVIIEQQTYSRS